MPATLPDDASRRGPRNRAVRWGAVLLFPLIVLVIGLPARLNGDIAYALGGIRVAGDGGVPLGDIFIARPWAYRTMLAALNGLSLGTGANPHGLRSEIIIRLATYAGLVATGVILWCGLRRHTRPAVASAVALTTTTALVLAPPWHFLEPDWLALPFAVLAVALALAIKPRVLAAVLAGIALCLTVAIKVATFPFAICAVVLLWHVDRRRARLTALAGIVCTLLWVAWFRLFSGWEWSWFSDQKRLLSDAPTSHPFDVTRYLPELGEAIRNAALISPICIVAIPAAIALVLHAPTRAARMRRIGVGVVLLGGAVAPGYAQGEWFMYHFASMAVLGAVIVGVAYGVLPHMRLPLIMTGLIVAPVTYWLQRRSTEWRSAHELLAFTVLAVLALAVCYGVRQICERTSGAARAGAGVLSAIIAGAAVAAIFAPPVTAGAPYSFSTYDEQIITHTDWKSKDQYGAFRRRIGADTPVIYLTYGAVGYALGNPTQCRYPSPQWLQRAETMHFPTDTKSYASNFDCLKQDEKTHAAKWLIWDMRWFPMRHEPLGTRRYRDANFDCSPGHKVVLGRGMLACPRR